MVKIVVEMAAYIFLAVIAADCCGLFEKSTRQKIRNLLTFWGFIKK